jgi:hypothetical protein
MQLLQIPAFLYTFIQAYFTINAPRIKLCFLPWRVSRKPHIKRVGSKPVDMKKIIFCLCLSFVFNNTFCQETKQSITKADYLKKSKRQKIVAWSLLGGGIVMFIGGIANNNDQPTYFGIPRTNQGLWLCYAGTASAVASFPFFFMSHKNKKKAASLALGNQLNYYPLQNTIAVKMQPVVTFKIGI